MTTQYVSIVATLKTIKDRMLAQGKPAIDDGGTCRYVVGDAPDAPQCAVGCLLPREVCGSLNGTVYNPGVQRALQDEGYPVEATENGDLNSLGYALRSAQGIHDIDDPSVWGVKFDELIAKYEGQ